MTSPARSVPVAPQRPVWQRLLWLAAGVASLLLGMIGIVVPLLPTTPFVLLAAFCFSRGSARCEAWMLNHPRLGPVIRDWRAHRAIPLRAKQFAFTMMALGSLWALYVLPRAWCWLPGACCAVVAAWMMSLPTRR